MHCSEAKGSFTFAASPHGDSVESCGRPGTSSCREANTADNLMLLDADTSTIGGEKLVKRGTKRSNTPQPEMSLYTDGQNNAKEAEDSDLFRHGAKSQAYARRRSKSSRENVNTVPVRSPPVPLLSSHRKDAKGVVQEAKNDDHGSASLAAPKPRSSNGKDMLNNASNNQMVPKMGSVQAIHEDKQDEKHEITNSHHVTLAPEISPNSVSDNSQHAGGGQMPSAAALAKSPHALKPEASSRISSLPSIHNEICREAHTPENSGNSCSDKSMVYAHEVDMENEASVMQPAIETARSKEKEVDLTCTDATKTTDEHSGKNANFVSVKKVGENSDEGLSNTVPVDNGDKKDGQLEGRSSPTAVVYSSTPIQPEVCTAVKDEIVVCNNVVDTQKDTGRPAISEPNKVTKEAGPDLDENNNYSNKLASVDVPPASLTEDMPNPVLSTKYAMCSFDNDVVQCNRNDAAITKECEDPIMIKKEHEDSILRRARLIEVHLGYIMLSFYASAFGTEKKVITWQVNVKRAGEQVLCNISLEKKRKSHWEFVLEEMAWMANDFKQVLP